LSFSFTLLWTDTDGAVISVLVYTSNLLREPAFRLGGRYMRTEPDYQDMSATGAFEEAVENLTEAVEEGENVVLTSRPYGGRDDVLDAVFGDGTDRHRVTSVTEGNRPTLPDDGVTVVEGCEYLYTRRLGGLESLEQFVESVASSDAVVVSSWNSYAWSYAVQATDIGDVFPVELSLPSLDSAQTARFIAAEYDVSEHEEDYDEVTANAAETWQERLPFDAVRFGIAESSDNVFEKVTGISRGNPGVARAVFESQAWENETDPVELSYEDAFTLYVVVTKGEVGRDVLRDVVEPSSLKKSLRRLSDLGLVEPDGERVSLRPERFADSIDHLERRRLLW
jgi:hypothetical protein